MRWTAVALQLGQETDNDSIDEDDGNRQNMTPVEPGGESCGEDGLAELVRYEEPAAAG